MLVSLCCVVFALLAWRRESIRRQRAAVESLEEFHVGAEYRHGNVVILICRGGGNDLSDHELTVLKDLPYLEELSLRTTRVTDAGLVHVGRLKRLKRLDLSRTRITDSGLKELYPLKRLATLNLDGTDVSPQGVSSLKKEMYWIFSIDYKEQQRGAGRRLYSDRWTKDEDLP